jgi:dephospho-CoA kinase
MLLLAISQGENVSSKWPGKYVIGITGNIATGKSVVRKMLEHLGAYSIDADALGHRAYSKGSPGYKPVVDLFGQWILGPDGQIDRSRLGRVVFTDPQAMGQLEKITHPLVLQAIDYLTRRASQTVVAIEAIKLIESQIDKNCDAVWVSYAPTEIQIARLMQARRMDENEARQRVRSQSPQDNKLASANVVIKTAGSFEDTWQQVMNAWQRTLPALVEPTAAIAAQPEAAGAAQAGLKFTVERARPRHSAEIAAFITRMGRGKTLTQADIMAAFGEKAFLLLQQEQKTVGVAGWQVENLVARTTDMYIDPLLPVAEALQPLISEMERASKDLQCEASLLFIQPELAQHEPILHKLGYERRLPNTLGVQAWQEAAADSMPNNTVLFFKQLRQDRILRPI